MLFASSFESITSPSYNFLGEIKIWGSSPPHHQIQTSSPPSSSSSSMEAGSSSSGRKKRVPSFLTKCEAMVDDPSTDSIISWRETGGGFVIRNDFEFEKHVLPKYFKHGNFQSFCRQLQEYGFRKIYTNTDRREYANKSFLKGRKDLLSTITRSESIQTTPMSNTKGIATSEAQKVGSCDVQLEVAKQIYCDGIRNESFELQKLLQPLIWYIDVHFKGLRWSEAIWTPNIWALFMGQISWFCFYGSTSTSHPDPL